jgi:hypothetical protein
MSTTLDRIPQSIRAVTARPDVTEKPRRALSALRRLLRAAADSWRFAQVCMRLSQASGEGVAAPVDAQDLLDRATTEHRER